MDDRDEWKESAWESRAFSLMMMMMMMMMIMSIYERMFKVMSCYVCMHVRVYQPLGIYTLYAIYYSYYFSLADFTQPLLLFLTPYSYFSLHTKLRVPYRKNHKSSLSDSPS